MLVEQRLVLISDNLRELERLAQTPPEDFLADPIRTAAAESYLRRSLEAVFDAGRHILAKIGAVDLASEYKGIARGLGEKGVVSEALGEKLLQMAGYRNRLVHLYHEVGNEELYDILSRDLGDLKAFIREIRAYLDKTTGHA